MGTMGDKMKKQEIYNILFWLGIILIILGIAIPDAKAITEFYNVTKSAGTLSDRMDGLKLWVYQNATLYNVTESINQTSGSAFLLNSTGSIIANATTGGIQLLA